MNTSSFSKVKTLITIKYTFTVPVQKYGTNKLLGLDAFNVTAPGVHIVSVRRDGLVYLVSAEMGPVLENGEVLFIGVNGILGEDGCEVEDKVEEIVIEKGTHFFG